jgi:hypothetical protein
MNAPDLVWHDPIVAEIHATRERLASKFQNDLVAYSKAAEEHCQVLGFKFVSPVLKQGTGSSKR